MGRFSLALACGVVLAGTAAHAQVSNIQSSADTTFEYDLTKEPATGNLTGTSVTFGPTNGLNTETYSAPGVPSSGGGDYLSYVTVTDTIFFESAGVLSGRGIQSLSTTNVSFDFSSNTDVLFNSLITPFGMGFYLADMDAACQFSNCPEAGFGANLSDLTGSVTGISQLGRVAFEFSITSDIVKDPLYTVAGALSLFRSDKFGYYIEDELADAGGKLFGFNASAANNNAVLSYIWDATPVPLNLMAGDHTLTYSTRVFTSSTANPLSYGSDGCTASLVAFAGFGDPIGRGGGDDSFAAAFASEDSFASARGSFDPSPQSANPCISENGVRGLNFTPARFGPPVLKDGVLTYSTPTDAAVPEPATWAMMIMGFGLIGATLRGRRLAGTRA